MTDLGQAQSVMDMLTGDKLPEGMTIRYQPQLSREEAFSVIWFLQEHLRVLPDNIEMCSVCKELFDVETGGHIIDSTDDTYDEWYEDIGVKQSDLEACDGTKFCSAHCEVKFWRSKNED